MTDNQYILCAVIIAIILFLYFMTRPMKYTKEEYAAEIKRVRIESRNNPGVKIDSKYGFSMTHFRTKEEIDMYSSHGVKHKDVISGIAIDPEKVS